MKKVVLFFLRRTKTVVKQKLRNMNEEINALTHTHACMQQEKRGLMRFCSFTFNQAETYSEMHED